MSVTCPEGNFRRIWSISISSCLFIKKIHFSALVAGVTAGSSQSQPCGPAELEVRLLLPSSLCSERPQRLSGLNQVHLLTSSTALLTPSGCPAWFRQPIRQPGGEARYCSLAWFLPPGSSLCLGSLQVWAGAAVLGGMLGLRGSPISLTSRDEWAAGFRLLLSITQLNCLVCDSQASPWLSSSPWLCYHHRTISPHS